MDADNLMALLNMQIAKLLFTISFPVETQLLRPQLSKE